MGVNTLFKMSQLLKYALGREFNSWMDVARCQTTTRFLPASPFPSKYGISSVGGKTTPERNSNLVFRLEWFID